MEVLLGLVAWLVGIAVFAAVGHLIWVAVRAVVRALTGPAAGQSATLVAMCPKCGYNWDHRIHGVAPCPACTWPDGPRDGGRFPAPRARPDLLLNQFRRRVEAHAKLGLIPPAVRDRLVAALDFAERPATAPAAEPGVTFLPDPAMPSPPLIAEPIPPRPTPAPAADLKPAALPPLAERAHAYRSFREEAAASATVPATPVPSTPAEPPKRGLALLGAFLEEKSIRWGELVGGLLIVGCSLALVVSFWSSIAERPWIKYGLLNGVTALLFALGGHAERRWKLPSTALGLLVIAALLTPLNFLAIASLVRSGGAEPVWGLAGEAAAVVGFGFLVVRAGRWLVPGSPWTLGLGVVGASATMLVLRRSVDLGAGAPAVGATLLGLGAAPWLAQGAALAAWMARTRDDRDWGEPRAAELLRLLGLGAFAAAVALGLTLAHAGPVVTLAGRITPLAPVVGLVILAPGVRLWQRATAPGVVGYRTAGAAIAVLGVLVLLAGVALAWPTPARAVPVALLDALALTILAVVLRVPAAHALAGACLVAAYLMGWAAWSGRLGWLETRPLAGVGALLSAATGTALLPASAVFAGLAGAAAWRVRRDDARSFALVGVVAAGLGLGLLAAFGFARPGDPAGATWALLGYAALAAVAALALARHPLVRPGLVEARVAAGAGSALALAALVQGLGFGGLPVRPGMPWTAALLAHATGFAAAAVARSIRVGAKPSGEELQSVDAGPGPFDAVVERSALGSAAGAAGLLAWGAFVGGPPADLAANGAWLAAVVVAMAWRLGSADVLCLGQVASAFAAVYAALVAAGGPAARWLDPSTVQAEALALGGLALGWIGLRRAARDRFPAGSRWPALLASPAAPTADHALGAAVVGLLAWLVFCAAAPGIVRELSPQASPADLGAGLAGWLKIRPDRAVGLGSWAAWAMAVAVVAAIRRERPRPEADPILFAAVLAAAVPLLAGRFEPAGAVASATRWLGMAGAVGLAGWTARRRGIEPGPATWTGLAALAVPVVGLTVYELASTLAGWPVAGPAPGSWFGRFGPLAPADVRLVGSGLVRIGPVASAVIPLAGLALGGAVLAGAGRSRRLALGAGGLVCLAAVVGVLRSEGPAGMAGAGGWVALAHGLALAAAGSALAWVGLRDWADRRALAAEGRRAALQRESAKLRAEGPAERLRVAVDWDDRSVRFRVGQDSVDNPLGWPMPLVRLAVATVAALVAAATWTLWLDPVPTPALRSVADAWGWLAALGTAAAVVLVTLRRDRIVLDHRGGIQEPIPPPGITPDLLGLGAVVLAGWLGLAVAGRDPGNWFSYHAAMVGAAMSCALLILGFWIGTGLPLHRVWDRHRHAVMRWAPLALGILILFAVRSIAGDPQAPWWASGGLLVAGGLAAALAGWSGWVWFYLLLGSALVNLAVTMGWVHRAFTLGGMGPPWLASAPALMAANALALAVPVPAWLWFERQGRAGGRSMPVHPVPAWSAVVLAGLVTLSRLGGDGRDPGSTAWGWLAVLAATSAVAVGLWDRRVRGAVAGLDLAGLVAAGWTVAQFDLPPQWFAWTGTLVLAAYSVLTAYLWSRRDGLRALADRTGIPRRGDETAANPLAHLGWLVPANLARVAAVLAFAFGLILTDPDAARRGAVAQAALAQGLTVGLLARGARRTALQRVALAAIVLGAVATGWAAIAPESKSALLDRAAVVLAASAAGAAVFGLGLAKIPRRAGEWVRAAQGLVPTLLGVAGLAAATILGSELMDRANGTPIAIHPIALGGVAVTLVGLAVAALVAAVVPGRDPLRLPERGRTAYVYGAEVLLAAAGAHVRLTMPWLFSGRFLQYWPLMLMGLAFVGVGLSELFRRQGRTVLAEPLERTGALLPILPMVAAYWQTPRPGEDVVYLVLVGALYSTLATLRTSLGFGVLAALAANGAVWTWLSHQDSLGLLRHPQLWVVPPCLCVLAGSWLNRDRLTQAQRAGIRYAAATAIYLASTADIVLVGVAQAPWLPIVLAALSLVGIFAGISLRVRGFLFLGLGFLSLSIFSVVWYAAVDLHQTWLWAASGVVAGVVILAVFALFEKKRQEVLKVVGQIRDWNP